jgi:ATP synthase protein I
MGFSWTLTMPIIGLFISCLNAWVAMEHKKIMEELEGNDE